MSDRYKPPPPYVEGENYEVWKEDIQLWAGFTSLEKKRQGTALYLELTGKVRECVRSLGNTVLSAEDGLDQVLTHLDKVYKQDAGRVTFQLVEQFAQFKRTSDLTVESFIIEFERLVTELKTHKVILPDAVITYRFLKNAKLGEDKTDLVKTAVSEMTYDNVLKAVKRISCGKLGDTSQPHFIKPEPEEAYLSCRGRERERDSGEHERSSSQPVKKSSKEESLYTSHFRGRSQYRGNRGRSPSRGRGSYPSGGRGSSLPPTLRRQNQFQNGEVSRCFKCQSTFHFARDCPEKQNNRVDFK